MGSLKYFKAFVVVLVAFSSWALFLAAEEAQAKENSARGSEQKQAGDARGGGGDATNKQVEGLLGGASELASRGKEQPGSGGGGGGDDKTKLADSLPIADRPAPVVDTKPVLEKATETVGSVSERSEPAVKEASETVLGTATPVLEGTEETLGKVTEPVRQAAEPVTSPVLDVVSPVLDAAEPVARPVRDALGSAGEPVLQTNEPAVQPAHDTLEPVAPTAPGRSDQTAPDPSAVYTPAEAPILGGSVAAEQPVGEAASPATTEPLFRGGTVGELFANATPEVAWSSTTPSSALKAEEGTTEEGPPALSPTTPSAVLKAEEGTTEEDPPALSPAASEGPREVPSTPLGHDLFASGYPAAAFSAGAGSAQEGRTSWWWPAFPGPIAPSGSSPVGFGGGGPGTAGGLGLLGALALLFALSPPAGRLLRSSCEFLRPDSALRLVAERPG